MHELCDGSTLFVENPLKVYEKKVAFKTMLPENNVLSTGFIAHELITLVFEQHIKRGKTSIDTGNVLLKINLVFIGKYFMSINALLHYPQPVAQHNELIKKSFYCHFFFFE